MAERSAPAAVTTSRGGPALAVLLTLLVALGPVSTDLYLPSLPGIAADLDASPAQAQLTVGLFIAGFGAMMLVCGPLGDRFGRRPILLAGLAIYVLASIGCALSPTIGLLLAARFAQAVGACVGPVLGRAIVRDLYGPSEAGRILGYMASAMALAPLIGPFIGGWLEVAFGWRANFWALTAFGLILMGLLAWRLEETLPERRSGTFSLARLVADYALILQNRTFLGFMLCVALTFGALFTWISNSAFVVIDYFDVAPERFGWAFGTVIAGFVLGGYAGSRAGMRFGLGRATAIGCTICATAGVALAISGWTGLGDLYAIVLLMAASFVGVGVVAPQATAGALGPFPHLAGTAAALLGFLQMSTGLLVNALTSATFDGTPRPMVTVNLACGLVALAAWWWLLRNRE